MKKFNTRRKTNISEDSFTEKILTYARSLIWFKGPSFKDVDQEIAQAIKKSDQLLNNNKVSSYSDFKCNDI